MLSLLISCVFSSLPNLVLGFSIFVVSYLLIIDDLGLMTTPPPL